MKDISALAQIAIRSKYERKSKHSATGDLGLGKRKQQEESSRALEKTEAGVSFSQSEVSTPRPITRKTLLSYNFKQWFGRSTLKDEKTGQPEVFYHGSKTFGIDNTASWAFDDKRLGKKPALLWRLWDISLQRTGPMPWGIRKEPGT